MSTIKDGLTDEEHSAFLSWSELRRWPSLRDKALCTIDSLKSDITSLKEVLELICETVHEWSRDADEGCHKRAMHRINNLIEKWESNEIEKWGLRTLAKSTEPECSYAGRCNSSRCPKHGQSSAPIENVESKGVSTVGYETHKALSDHIEYCKRARKMQEIDAELANLKRMLSAHIQTSRTNPQINLSKYCIAQCQHIDGGPMGSDKQCILPKGHPGGCRYG